VRVERDDVLQELARLSHDLETATVALRTAATVPPTSDRGGRPDNSSTLFAGRNVVILTTVVHLSGQLSNLRHELRSLFDAL
jgi:hypothetical protein